MSALRDYDLGTIAALVEALGAQAVALRDSVERFVAAYMMPATVDTAVDVPEDMPAETEASFVRKRAPGRAAELRAVLDEIEAKHQAQEQAMAQVEQQVIALAHELGLPMDEEIPGTISRESVIASLDLPDGIARLQRFRPHLT